MVFQDSVALCRSIRLWVIGTGGLGGFQVYVSNATNTPWAVATSFLKRMSFCSFTIPSEIVLLEGAFYKHEDKLGNDPQPRGGVSRNAN